MRIRKGYILALGYERGAIWVKKTGKGKGLSLGAGPPCINCPVVLPKVDVVLKSL